MNQHHQTLIDLFVRNQLNPPNSAWVQKYLGTSKIYYGLTSPFRDRLVKDYLKSQNIDLDQYLNLLLSLANGTSFEEFASIGTVLINFPKLRVQLSPSVLPKLLENTQGWAEADCICQSSFTASEILNNWSQWQPVLRQLNASANIQHRRSSLVLLCKPLRQSADPRLFSQATILVDNLCPEKDILITKAISWVLRSAIKHHHSEVGDYLDLHLATLPKIALRETRKKLLTGRKNG